jgi:hypothetical protein
MVFMSDVKFLGGSSTICPADMIYPTDSVRVTHLRAMLIQWLHGGVHEERRFASGKAK